MKKYLITGVAAIAFVVAFTSCSKSTDLYDQAAVDEKNRQEQENKATSASRLSALDILNFLIFFVS